MYQILDDIIYEIAKYLRPIDLYNICLVSKGCKEGYQKQYFYRTNEECIKIKRYNKLVKQYHSEVDKIYIRCTEAKYWGDYIPEEWKWNSDYIPEEWKWNILGIERRIGCLNNFNLDIVKNLIFNRGKDLLNWDYNVIQMKMINLKDNIKYDLTREGEKLKCRYYKIKNKNGLYYLHGIYVCKKDYQIERINESNRTITR